MGIIRYREGLDYGLGVVLSVYFESRGPKVIDYSLVLLLESDGHTETIRIYDSAHEVNEMHRYSRDKGKQDGVVFNRATLGEGMRAAMKDIKKRLSRDDRGVGRMTVRNGVESPASRKMEEAIDAVLEEKPIVPDCSSFIDADTAFTEKQMKRAASEGYSAVVVYPDGATRVYSPDEVLGSEGADAA